MQYVRLPLLARENSAHRAGLRLGEWGAGHGKGLSCDGSETIAKAKRSLIIPGIFRKVGLFQVTGPTIRLIGPF